MKIVTFFASVQEAPTPTISNRSPTKNPPPLSLDSVSKPRTSSSSHPSQRSQFPQGALFSSPTTEPIVVYRSNPSSNRTILQTTIEQPTSPTFAIYPPSAIAGPRLAYSGMDDISSALLNKDWKVFPTILICDLLKAGVPLQVLRNVLQRMFRFIYQQNNRQFLTRGLSFRTMTTQSTHPRQKQPQQGLVEIIRGLPNLGNTCFLNSVLQALASLSPFLIYLDRIIQVREELCLDDDDDDNNTNDASTNTNFSRQLLEILNGINGSSSKFNQNFDPRSLLKQIGEHNPQFRSRHMEQQDAQELLQTLVNIVITDARLDKTCASDQPHLRFHSDGGEDEYSYEETLTAAMAGDDLSLDRSPSSSVDLEDGVGGGDGFISLPDLVHRIEVEMEQRETVEIVEQEKNGGKYQTYQREEKKQEDFEIGANSFEGEEAIASASLLKTTKRNIKEIPKEEVRQLSASMKIMKSTMSSITPSPLSGWIGSALKCCDCNHVRAIQNAPFLNLPLVPTSVLNYHTNVHMARVGSASTPNRSPLPSCTLDDCLQDFTSVERVNEVECRSCTIRKKLETLDDESILLRGAIESMERKILQKGVDPADHTKYLRQELSEIEVRMIKLKFLDPDDEDLSLLNKSLESYTDSDDLISSASGEEAPKGKLERCDALKCLTLTRCPSILCCHIQRRYLDPLTNRMEKCIQFVEFPQVLDLSPYCAYSPMTNTSWAAGTSQIEFEMKKSPKVADRKKLSYRLQGIIEHRGNAFNGHYVSYRRNRSGKWFRISDANISPIPWQQVRTCQAYMLFYEAV